MHTYYYKKRTNQDSGRSRHGYRRSPSRADYSQQLATSSRENTPPSSSSRIGRGTDYSPDRVIEIITSSSRKQMKNTDPETPRIDSMQRGILWEQDTQNLITYPSEEKRQAPVESDDSAVSEHLERLATEIRWLYNRLRSLFWLIVILGCLAIILRVWLQEVPSWINWIYVITGIIASIIVIIEFMKRNR